MFCSQFFHNTSLFLIITSVTLCSSITSAEIYQWRDDKGKLYISDAPPPGVKTETVELPPLNLSEELKIRRRPDNYADEPEPHEIEQQQAFKKACEKARKRYVKLKWGESRGSRHVVLQRDGKTISRREQNEIAEEFRKKMGAKGCQFQEKKW